MTAASASRSLFPGAPRDGHSPSAAAWAAMAISCKDQGNAGHCWEGKDALSQDPQPGFGGKRAGEHVTAAGGRGAMNHMP